ncbi:MAG: siphovirus Gp157 family protein [Planctomycetaceae bacterium]|nr:siphovirus Gp157 family protein [Planctomycetaceae bacterium]
MPGQSLFDISEDLAALDDLIFENAGNLDSPDVVAALDALEAEIVNNMVEKIDNYAGLIKSIQARSEVRKQEAKRLDARARIDLNTAKSLLDRLKLIFERHKIPKLETPRFRVGIVNNGGLLPLIIDGEPANLPENFKITQTTVVPDTEAIRAALAAGQEIPGRRLGERGQRLAIR